ncbi:hypothetical protein [Frankia sp. Cas4]|uniref:lipopolysaccharide biosynthesis protein n=1 Tax=Frankia sp. Cas4 TaxID=3073927 RepID=UPI002AD1F989|nr:hypothetical protein [Frankia sp. Cas4]
MDVSAHHGHGHRGPADRERALVRTANALMTTTVATSALGVAFWVIAARLCPPAQIGRDTVLVVVMQTIGAVADLNLNATLPRLLPITPGRRRMVGLSFGLGGTAALMIGGAVVLVGPAVSRGLGFLHADPGLEVLFPVAAALWTLFALQDSVLATVGRAGWVPVENTVFGLAKILLLIILTRMGSSHAVFLAWVLPMAALTVPIGSWLLRRGLVDGPRSRTRRPDKPARSALLRFLAWDYGALLAAQTGVVAVPLGVLAWCGDDANASFSVGFTIVLAVESLVLSVGLSLTIQAASAVDTATALTRSALRRFGPGLLAGVALAVIAAPLLLAPYGRTYVNGGTTALRLLLVASIPQAAVTLRCVLWRLDGLSRRSCAIQVMSLFVLFLTLFPLTRWWGTTGAASAWLAAHSVGALLVAPGLARRITARTTPTGCLPTGGQPTGGQPTDGQPGPTPSPQIPSAGDPRDLMNTGADT